MRVIDLPFLENTRLSPHAPQCLHYDSDISQEYFCRDGEDMLKQYTSYFFIFYCFRWVFKASVPSEVTLLKLAYLRDNLAQ